MKLLTFADLQERGVRFSRVHLWRLVNAGRFPAPIQVSARRKAWPEAEVDAWLRERMAERKGGWRPPERKRLAVADVGRDDA